MKLKVEVDIDTAKIMRQRGLGGDNGAQIHLANKVKSLCDPYVPMSSGTLKNTAAIASDGSSITYIQPYAHYQYAGQVLVGRAPKVPNGKALTYSGGGMRGAQWDKRMIADKGEELARDMAKFVGG